MSESVAPPDGPKERFIARLVSFLTRMLYREIDVHWVEPPPESGPQLTVANHFGGVADAIVLFSVSPRRPGVIARSVIWKPPLVGRLMNWIGAIPVHKADDDGGAGSSNDQMFRSCYAALREGGHLLIFPEGVTRNEPSMAPVKTGAARIALGARATGAEGLTIVPIGIHYEDKALLRSRIVVNGGRPIDLDAAVAAMSAAEGSAPVTADDREAVHALTDEIAEHLRTVAPDYADWGEAHALSSAAEVTLRAQLDDPSAPVPIGLRDRLANALADRPPSRRAAIVDAVHTYERDLEALGVTDADLHQRASARRLSTRLVVQLVAGLLLLPFAVVGAVLNALPLLVVWLVGRRRMSASLAATVKPVAAIGAFGAMWTVVAWSVLREWGAAGLAASIVLLPVYLTATLIVGERLVLAWRALRRHLRTRHHGPPTAVLAQERAAVIESVLAR
jgi:glycerol-3-phosphate O-acyltransferase/dihydroxyacetone phosphate acyltransferase